MSSPNDTTSESIWLYVSLFAVNDATGLNVRFNPLVERYEIRIGPETGAWLDVSHPLDLRHVDGITNNWILLPHTQLETRYALKCASVEQLREIKRQRQDEARDRYRAHMDEMRRRMREEEDRRYWVYKQAVRDE